MRNVFGIVSFLVLMLGLIGCEASTPKVGPIAERLQAEDPDVRIQAAVEAGNTKNKKVVPLLVDRLSDGDSDVSFFSGLALERIVGKDVCNKMGWVSYDPPEKRDQAIRRWRQWIQEHYGVAASQPATTPPS